MAGGRRRTHAVQHLGRHLHQRHARHPPGHERSAPAPSERPSRTRQIPWPLGRARPDHHHRRAGPQRRAQRHEGGRNEQRQCTLIPALAKSRPDDCRVHLERLLDTDGHQHLPRSTGRVDRRGQGGRRERAAARRQPALRRDDPGAAGRLPCHHARTRLLDGLRLARHAGAVDGHQRAAQAWLQHRRRASVRLWARRPVLCRARGAHALSRGHDRSCHRPVLLEHAARAAGGDQRLSSPRAGQRFADS